MVPSRQRLAWLCRTESKLPASGSLQASDQLHSLYLAGHALQHCRHQTKHEICGRGLEQAGPSRSGKFDQKAVSCHSSTCSIVCVETVPHPNLRARNSDDSDEKLAARPQRNSVTAANLVSGIYLGLIVVARCCIESVAGHFRPYWLGDCCVSIVQCSETF